MIRSFDRNHFGKALAFALDPLPGAAPLALASTGWEALATGSGGAAAAVAAAVALPPPSVAAPAGSAGAAFAAAGSDGVSVASAGLYRFSDLGVVGAGDNLSWQDVGQHVTCMEDFLVHRTKQFISHFQLCLKLGFPMVFQCEGRENFMGIKTTKNKQLSLRL